MGFRVRCSINILLTLLLACGTANGESIPLIREHGTFLVPVIINDKISLNFTVDSGAADVSIPTDVFSTLIRAGTITKNDLLDVQVYKLADGSQQRSQRFRIRSLRLGGLELRDVTASVAPAAGSLLLGQSFLTRFGNWSIDNRRNLLIINQQPGSGDLTPAVAPPIDKAPVSTVTSSINETLDFVETEVGSPGHVDYVRTSHNIVENFDFTNKVSNTFSLSHIGGCLEVIDRTESIDRAPAKFLDRWVNFKSVEKIELSPEPEAANRRSTDFLVTIVTPIIFTVTIVYRDHKSNFSIDPYLMFYDEDAARRVAEALTHVVELCSVGLTGDKF